MKSSWGMLGAVAVGLVLGQFAADSPGAVRAASGEETALLRRHPTKVSWADAEIRESSNVEAAPRLEKVQYEYALGMKFITRARNEAAEGLLSGHRQVSSEATTSGYVRLAANFDHRIKGWTRFKEELLDQLRELTPAGYGDYLGRFKDRVMALGTSAAEPYTLVYCTSISGETEISGEIKVQASVGGRGEGGWETGSTGFANSTPICSALEFSLGSAAISEVITTDMLVSEEVEESLTTEFYGSGGAPPAQWPKGAALERRTPPEGVSAYAKNWSEDGVPHFEELSDATRATSSETDERRILIAKAPPAELSRDLVDHRSFSTRWRWSSRVQQLGAEPRTGPITTGEVVMGTFFTTNAGEPDFNGFKESVTRTLDKHDGLLSQAALAGALMDLTAKLGVEDAFTVFCSDGLRGEDTAVYCVLRACAAVTNPKVLCGAIRGGFGG